MTTFMNEISATDTDPYAAQRHQMVQDQIVSRGIKNEHVLHAMKTVPRHEFVQPEYIHEAYTDSPLPIGTGQTISQPYIVALMTEMLNPQEDDKILEIGTGSGYQAAVLAKLAKDVYTIEIIKDHAHRAKTIFSKLGYNTIHARTGDGYFGWPDESPFNGIILTAAPPSVPTPLIEQLKEGGKLALPEGGPYQYLKIYTKQNATLVEKKTIPVQFVPMTGYIQSKKT